MELKELLHNNFNKELASALNEILDGLRQDLDKLLPHETSTAGPELFLPVVETAPSVEPAPVAPVEDTAPVEDIATQL